MITIKNMILSAVIVTASLSNSLTGKMSQKDAEKIENRMIATGGVIGGIVEATAVFKYTKHSPSLSKMRIPLACLTSAVASLGGMVVGMAGGEIISEKTVQLMDKMSAEENKPELLTPHEKTEIEEIVHQKS